MMLHPFVTHTAQIEGYGLWSAAEPLPDFILHGQTLEWMDRHKYLGVHVTSYRADIFSEHFEHKAKAASKVTNVSFTLLNYLGDLPPREGLILYKSRVDPHLTHGAEVALRVSPTNMALLRDAQVKYLRRLLRVQKRSMRTSLFTETGIPPISFRRVSFALHFLSRLVTMKDHRIVQWCLAANEELWRHGSCCWLGDLAVVLRDLGFAPSDTGLTALSSLQGVQNLLKNLPLLASNSITEDINASSRLELVRSRIERTRSGKMSADPLIFRAYLLLRIPAHRIALTRLLTSNHALAIERGRWLRIDGTIVTVPRPFRICRWCQKDVENECHILFVCPDPTLSNMRVDFLAEIWNSYPALRGRASGPKELLHMLLTYPDLLHWVVTCTRC